MAQWYSFLGDRSDCSRISSICTIYIVRSNQDNIACTTGMRRFDQFRSIAFFLLLFLDTLDLFSTFLGFKKLIHFEESFLQCFLIFWCPEVSIVLQFFRKVPFYKFCTLRPYITDWIPPWPSNTPNNPNFFSTNGAMAICASSINNLHPIYELYPYRRCERERNGTFHPRR